MHCVQRTHQHTEEEVEAFICVCRAPGTIHCWKQKSLFLQSIHYPKPSFRMCSLCHSICDQCHHCPSSPVFHLRMLCSAPQQCSCFFYTRTHVSPSARRAHSGCDFLELEVYTLFGWQVPWLWLLGDIIGIMVSALHACRCFPGRCGHTSTWLIRFSTDVHGSSDSARSSFLINSFSTL